MLESEILSEILDEQEQTWVQQFYENEHMREAVKKVLLAPLYYQGVLRKSKPARTAINWIYDHLMNNNENLGAIVHARTQGEKLVEQGFVWLSKIKKNERSQIQSINQAR